jgi:hypothetical protein
MSGSLIPRGGAKGLRKVLFAFVALAAFCAMAGTALAHKTPHVNIVSQAATHPTPPPNTTYYETIQAAVNASHKGDWVLIEPGEYDEEVKVTKANEGIHIRGMNRNTVILNGQHKVGNGILVEKANNVWVENLTAHDYDHGPECPDESCGNEVWWTGGVNSHKQSVHGWFGKYLTAYDTGQNGGYGIFTQNEHGGFWEHIYASGFDDSGIYIGACWECQARVSDAVMEKNSVGYSGSNSGGRLVIEKSVFKDNAAGIVPNGESPGDGPPPQDGECNAKKPHKPYKIIPNTEIERCTVFKENLVTENNNLETPVNGSTEIAPWGVGIELPGDMADLIENNTVTNNANVGILGFEYPNPFPPEEDSVYFQLSGNKIADNKLSNNGYRGGALAGDITLQGGAYPHGIYTSDNNCAIGNETPDGVHPRLLETDWSCALSETPPPENGAGSILYIAELSEENAATHKGTNQPAPGPQETMPEPCEEVPANPLCS